MNFELSQGQHWRQSSLRGCLGGDTIWCNTNQAKLSSNKLMSSKLFHQRDKNFGLYLVKLKDISKTK